MHQHLNAQTTQKSRPLRRAKLAKTVGVNALFPGAFGSAMAYEYCGNAAFAWLCGFYFALGSIILLSVITGGIKDT